MVAVGVQRGLGFHLGLARAPRSSEGRAGVAELTGQTGKAWRDLSGQGRHWDLTMMHVLKTRGQWHQLYRTDKTHRLPELHPRSLQKTRAKGVRAEGTQAGD